MTDRYSSASEDLIQPPYWRQAISKRERSLHNVRQVADATTRKKRILSSAHYTSPDNARNALDTY